MTHRTHAGFRDKNTQRYNRHIHTLKTRANTHNITSRGGNTVIIFIKTINRQVAGI